MANGDLLTLIGKDTQLKRTSAKHGGEYSGACPICHAGTDRFKVWPELGRWACLGASAGRSGCDKGGDAIQYLRERDHLSYREACERLGIEPHAPAGEQSSRRQTPAQPAPPSPYLPSGEAYEAVHPHTEALNPPNPTWQAHAGGWAARCAALLWGDEGVRAREYLHKRGLFDGVLRACNVGYNPLDVFEEYEQWGLPQPKGNHRIWLPRGITFPWYVDGGVWRLNIRRPLTPAQIAQGEAKYIGPAGFGNALYNARSLRRDRAVILVEGEVDALTIVQACGEQVAVVATGSTSGGRRLAWVARLALAPTVLVAFDADKFGPDGAPGAGDRAATWWLNALPKAHRWQPLHHDVNTIPDPEDVLSWVRHGLDQALHASSTIKQV
jgi:DNA primase